MAPLVPWGGYCHLMAFVHEVQIISSNFPGAPGYTNLYFATDVLNDGADHFAAARGFLLNLGAAEPTAWSGQINPVGRVLETNTGILARFTDCPATYLAPVAGTSGLGWGAGPAGAVLAWQTGTINRGRVVRGRTFIVPIAKNYFEDDGTLTGEAVTFLIAAGNQLIATNVGFSVWSRPRLGAGGLLAPVLSVRVNDRAAVLTSRRA